MITFDEMGRMTEEEFTNAMLVENGFEPEKEEEE